MLEAPTSTAPLEQAIVGLTLDGKYRIDRPIGRGGMGVVFLATHVGTGRPVAVKVIASQLVENAEARERFSREAQAAGRIRHPNIVDVTDFGVTRVGVIEMAYLVMEYLEGQTLRELLERQRVLPVAVVVEVVEQVALALAVAHRAGIVHRDLKPDNVWLIPDPRGGHVVRVLDFGIAKLRDGTPRELERAPRNFDAAHPATGATACCRSPGNSTSSDTMPVAYGTDRAAAGSESPDSLTIAGTTLGTPFYMSPEQCAGSRIDARSDVYSLGVLAFEALTGERPFEGTFHELVSRHLSETPRRVDQVHDGLTAQVANVVARALAKDPAARQASAAAFAGSLRVAAEGPSVVLRRALALYVERFEPFLRIAFRAARPVWAALIALVAVFTLLHGEPRRAGLLALLVSVGAWGGVVMMSNAAFAVAIERLRSRPLEPIRVGEVFAEVRERLGLPHEAGDHRTLARLVSLYLRSESKAPLGTGDLAFQIAFIERLTPAEAGARCRALSAGISRAYHWAGIALLVGLLLAAFLETTVVLSVVLIVHREWAALAAVITATTVLPLNAVWMSPLFSSAFPLLYFRARQANGEDVAISAIASTRL